MPVLTSGQGSRDGFGAPQPPIGQLIGGQVAGNLPLHTVEEFGAAADGITDDTAVVNAAMAAASARAADSTVGKQSILYFQPGRTYLLQNALPQSNVVVWAYGAKFVFGPSAANKNVFLNPQTNPLVNFEIRGGWFAGRGDEGSNQNPIVIRNGTNIKIIDCRMTNLPGGSIQPINSQQVWVDHVTAFNCGFQSGAGNVINLVADQSSNTSPLTDVWVTDCFIDGYGEGIALVPTSVATQTVPMRIHISRNIVTARDGTKTVGSIAAGIEIENGGQNAVPVDTIEIQNNIIDGTAPYNPDGFGISGITVFNDSPISDPTVNRNILITGNRIMNCLGGISAAGSRMEICNNRISNTGVTGAGTTTARAGIVMLLNTNTQVTTMTGTTTIGSNQVPLTVTTGQANIANGMLIRGVGIPAGTTIVSGSQTGTLVMSQQATAAGLITLTIMPQMTGNLIADNVLHLQPDCVGISLQQMTNSTVKGNLIQFIPGSVINSGSSNSGIWMNFCSFMRIKVNDIDYAPENGIYANHCNDITAFGNNILNAAEGAANGSGSTETNGIHFGTEVPGATTLISYNQIDDTRTNPATGAAAHVMTRAVFVTSVNSIGNRQTGMTVGNGNGTTVVGF